jgi:hypothetical protein
VLTSETSPATPKNCSKAISGSNLFMIIFLSYKMTSIYRKTMIGTENTIINTQIYLEFYYNQP